MRVFWHVLGRAAIEPEYRKTLTRTISRAKKKADAPFVGFDGLESLHVQLQKQGLLASRVEMDEIGLMFDRDRVESFKELKTIAACWQKVSKGQTMPAGPQARGLFELIGLLTHDGKLQELLQDSVRAAKFLKEGTLGMAFFDISAGHRKTLKAFLGEAKLWPALADFEALRWEHYPFGDSDDDVLVTYCHTAAFPSKGKRLQVSIDTDALYVAIGKDRRLMDKLFNKGVLNRRLLGRR